MDTIFHHHFTIFITSRILGSRAGQQWVKITLNSCGVSPGESDRNSCGAFISRSGHRRHRLHFKHFLSRLPPSVPGILSSPTPFRLHTKYQPGPSRRVIIAFHRTAAAAGRIRHAGCRRCQASPASLQPPVITPGRRLRP